jgi:hypothetical protein
MLFVQIARTELLVGAVPRLRALEDLPIEERGDRDGNLLLGRPRRSFAA